MSTADAREEARQARQREEAERDAAALAHAAANPVSPAERADLRRMMRGPVA